jgi:uncharacterized membrane protein YraQ (UPF0718 family)
MRWFAFSWQNFWFSFLALVFEGVPFILLGSLISGIIGSFVPARVITGLLPKRRFPAILVSGLLGVIFPVCDCGTVPIVRRILKKGVPLSCGITYMLASPIVNPLVIFSTIVAFQGQAPLLNAGLRIGFGYFIAVTSGLIVSSLQSESILRKGLVTTGRSSRTAFTIAPLYDSGVAGPTEQNFRLTRMFIWCCAADARPIHVTVEVSAPVGVPDLQWVKVIGRPEYSFADGHAHLLVKAYSVVPIKAPKDAMLY